MWTLSVSLNLVSLCISLHLVTSHICLLFPRQRGTLDVSKAGSVTCSRHVAPCGGEAVEAPHVIFTAGQTVFMRWQQNLNHYEPGFFSTENTTVGYMDLSLATSPNSSEFITLAVVSDLYLYAQYHRKNFTVAVKIPDTECDHCVIRARYKPHKPGQTPFLQCSDIKIVSSSSPVYKHKIGKYHTRNHLDTMSSKEIGPLKRALTFTVSTNNNFRKSNKVAGHTINGFGFNPFEPNKTDYVSINVTTGELRVMNILDFGIDAMNMKWVKEASRLPGKFMVDDVVSIDYPRGTSNILLHTIGSRDEPAAMLFIIGSTNGSLVQYSDIFRFTGGAINAMSWYTYGTSATFRIQPMTPGQEGWYFEAGILDFGGLYEKRIVTPSPESIYVNFQWLETDVNDYRLIYALLGNENAPEKLSSRIYTFDLFNGNFLGYVELDVSKYTFMSVHSYPKSRDLFAFSPGLWNSADHAWSLVAIDVKSGDVKKRCHIAPPGIFERYYGGSVHQGQTNQVGLLYHVLRLEDSEADMLVGVDPRTCAVTFSGATNLRHVHALQRVDPDS